MEEWFRLVAAPRPCAYLPSETAALELRLIGSMSAAEYDRLLERGYRRFGHYVFRPACPACRQCLSLRVIAGCFEPGPAERRILKKNRTITAELSRPAATPDRVELYNAYHSFMHRHRGWPLERATLRSYAASFLGDFDFAREWLYREDGRLLGVALMDETPEAVSLAYCYYDPAWRPRSPGSFSILRQLLYARETGRRYAYLGYWIRSCPSMSYKARYRPHQLLRRYPGEEESPEWEPGVETAGTAACASSGLAGGEG